MADTVMEILTPKQAQFVKEYVIDFNGTQAAIRAGYSDNGASVTGTRLLGNPKIALAVDEARKKVAERAQLSAAWVLTALEQNHKIARDKGELAQSTRAVELIGKHLGMFSDKAHIETDINLRVITGIDAGVGSKVERPDD